ncbi:sugar ABC transporter permease [Caldanaerobacter subterraneus subsp. yonseiensis KB-1]|uniref:Sugar ABC transporter permease n=1 Tax=Caldanaerobacter subterraneus subsp. yonseiensis KB-1 TaxID=1388761 RepID=U5CTM3_CALSX|nr:ABC transporter permease [Caldanaerobacter subterraneus]ERM93308.1 sugar ABC transporter permease [Caldanaerobacter subterraneus subsp. yonseiensis KB-1]
MRRSYKILLYKVLSPIIAILIAALLSSIAIVAIGENPLLTFYTMFKFAFRRLDSIAIILYNSTPLIFSGLAVSIGFRMGLFNIGVEGQYLIGTFLAALVGFSLKGLSPFIHIPLVILVGMLGGMIWAYLPVYLKVKRGVHEVISTIMLNYISYSLIHYLISEVFRDRSQKLLIRTPRLVESALIPKLHGFLSLFGIELPKHVYLNWFFPIGLFLAVGVYYMLYYTPFGFELRSVGQNATASRLAGIKPENIFYKGFLLSGAIAGLVGLSDLMGYFGYMDLDFPRGYGFDGIAVALIAQNNPFGIIAAAMLLGFLKRGAEGIQTLLNIPMDTVVILQALMILSIVIVNKVINDYIKRIEKKGVA